MQAEVRTYRPLNLRVTDGYGEFDASYLREATAALKTWTRHIMALTKDPEESPRKFPPNSRKHNGASRESGLSV